MGWALNGMRARSKGARGIWETSPLPNHKVRGIDKTLVSGLELY